MKRLKLIYYVCLKGNSNIDLETAKEKKIHVLISGRKDEYANAIAEFTVGVMFVLARRLIENINLFKKGFLSIPCYLPWWGMMITHEGKVGPCARLAESSKINIFSSSMKDI